MSGISRFVGYVRTGYPDVAPRTGHVPLLALLPRRLSDDEVAFVASVLAQAGPPIMPIDVRAAITLLLRDDPVADDTVRVSQHLADEGWLVMNGAGRQVACLAAPHRHHPEDGDASPMTSHDDHLTGPPLVERLAHLAEEASTSPSIEDVFTDVCAAAVELIPGADLADVMLVRGRDVLSVGATSDLSVTLDELQKELGEGPCAQAAVDSTVVRADDLRTEQRWPRYAPAAVDLGVHSCLSFKLYSAGQVAATMNVFGYGADVWDDEAETIGAILAAHAGAAITSSRWGSAMNAPLSMRDRIGQAKGIVMERYGVDDVRAFAILRRLSKEEDVPIVDVAQRVIDTRTPDATASVTD